MAGLIVFVAVIKPGIDMVIVFGSDNVLVWGTVFPEQAGNTFWASA
ncbi:hypothetical protein [Kistimonas asteriae]|nr:hypothetical protein [Kistimonas asteriae]